MIVDPVRVAVDAARAIGLDVHRARLHRVRASALVELPEAGVMVRIEPPGSEHVAHRQVRVARLCATRGAPVMRLATAAEQPTIQDGCAVTFWELLVPTEPQLAPRELGALLRRLHDAVGPPFEVPPPPFEPIPDIRWLQRHPAPGFEATALAELDRRLEAREADWRSWSERDPLGERVLHGDLNADNVVVTARGPVLVDLESSGAGPASWDLVVPALGSRRYGLPEQELDQLVDGYGFDPRSWPGFGPLVRVYEQQVVAWAVHCADRSPALLTEARLRLSTLLEGSGPAWTLC